MRRRASSTLNDRFRPRPGSWLGRHARRGSERSERGCGSVRQMRFYGQQVNLTTSAIARMNVYLHDIEDAESKDRINAGTPLT